VREILSTREREAMREQARRLTAVRFVRTYYRTIQLFRVIQVVP
jgi:hypothetical protein